MRWLPFVAALAGGAGVLAGPAAAGGRASNPAFLGIGLDPAGIGCIVSRVLEGGPAKDAGLLPGDLIFAFEGKPIVGTYSTINGVPVAVPPCDALQAMIVAHSPGDSIRLDLRRGLEPVVVKVTLASRAEIADRRFVGHPFNITLADADDPQRTHDISDLRGHTVVLGLFHADGCVGCGAVFDRLRDGLRERLGDDQPRVFAVTPEIAAPKPSATGAPAPPASKTFSSSVPLVTGPKELFEQSDLFETDRIYFLILDPHGIVRAVSPIAPDSDDLDAALDEVLAAVEQQEHASRPRR